MAIIKFVKNPPSEKETVNNLLHYIRNPVKTKESLTGGINCDTDNLYEDFQNVQDMAEEKNGKRAKSRMAVHFIQSFMPEDDITPETAAQIAEELIGHEMFDGFQVTYAVHLDKKHLHTHFVVNTVNTKTLRKWQMSHYDMRQLKEYSNDICKKYGLSTIELDKESAGDKGIGAHNRISSWKHELYLAALNVSYLSASREDFIKNMGRLGYGVSWENDKKYITFTTPQGKKCRNRKLYPANKFTKDALNKQFRKNSLEYSSEQLSESMDTLIKKLKPYSGKYPMSECIEKENQALQGKKYNDWYYNNKESLLVDDKAALYRALNFHINNSRDINSFKEKLNKQGIEVEETDIGLLFRSKASGVEYYDFDLYSESQSYFKDDILKKLENNDDKHELWLVILKTAHNSVNKEDFIINMKKLGYDTEWNGDTEEKPILFRTPHENEFCSDGLYKYDELFTKEALENTFRESAERESRRQLIENLNMFSEVIQILKNIFGEAYPATVQNNNGGLSGEALRQFIYHYEKGTAGIYNSNLNDMSV